MKLQSINTSLPVEIDYQGKKISTGIFKKPVAAGPVYITKRNLAGDQQADLKNHGGEHKAVYAFSSDHFSYWCKVLNRHEIKPGTFGENLTVSGLDETDINIGDQVTIGQCILEVTQPRVPCYKLGLAVGNNKMPRLFIEHFATGVYFRVLQEGPIEVGNAVVVSKQNAFKLSVKSLFRAYFDKNYKDANALLEKALQIPELSPEWYKKINTRLSGPDEI